MCVNYASTCGNKIVVELQRGDAMCADYIMVYQCRHNTTMEHEKEHNNIKYVEAFLNIVLYGANIVIIVLK